MKRSQVLVCFLFVIPLISGVLLFNVLFLRQSTVHAASFFPGIYPSLTLSGAEADQQEVNNGQKLFLLNPLQTSLSLAENLLSWPSNSTTTLQSGGGTHGSSAVVVVNNAAVDRGSITVTLTRLDGNTNGGIWIVTAVSSPGKSITTPQPGATLPASSSASGGSTPYTVTGTSSAFEGTAGTVFLDNSSYATVTSANAKPTGNGQTFTAPLIYSVSGASQDGLVAFFSIGAPNGGAVLVKVVIS